MSICVVVADSSKARFLTAQYRGDPLQDEKDFIHPGSRLRDQELVADGSGSDSGGFGRHSMGHEKAGRQQQAEIFARELCDEMDKIRRRGDLGKIYLVAAPKFLGLLRANLTKQCADLVAGEVNKDLVDHSIEDIRAHLPKHI